MFRRILVPLDGSARAERALPVAARLARACGGSIFLVRVVSTAPAQMPSVPAKPNPVQMVSETDRQLAESYLEGVARSDVLSGLAVHIQVPVGLVAPGILSIAAEKYADIIVICSHGYTGIKRWWLMGSVAEKVSRFATIPVLVLREGGPVPEERQPGEHPLRFLVALDGSEYAQAALVPAANLTACLAAPGQGALHLVHVVTPDYRAKTAAQRFERSAEQNMSREYLKSLENRLRDGSLDPELAKLHLEFTSSVAINDDIAQGIVDLAENGVNTEGGVVFGGCDAIAMATSGFSGPQRWIGSITERVLHTTRLPLLLVRP
ncbi:MAG TPA: universal stress protein [Ktedonobacteraceae bacterium]|nr:universal stress protein [Ktedonobacteraceae bacterium]